MSFDKSFEGRLLGVTNQNSTLRLQVGGDTSGGTFTRFGNPMRGALIWDSCEYIITGLSVAGGATGGSYTITLETDAVTGFTGLPIAGVSGIGPNTRGQISLLNFHRSSGSPLPTHVTITQNAAGGGLWFQLQAIAKQYRGVLGTPGSLAERVIQVTALRGASVAGGAFTSGAGFGANQTVALGASLSNAGMNRIRLWDRAFYWVQAGNSVSGSHDVTLVGQVKGGTVAGFTFTIASTVGVAGGPLDAGNERLALQSSFFGSSPNYTHMIWTVVSAGGVSDARLIVLAKTGRGSLAKH